MNYLQPINQIFTSRYQLFTCNVS